MAEHDFFHRLAKHGTKVQDMLLDDENMYRTKCEHYRNTSVRSDGTAPDTDPVFGYETPDAWTLVAEIYGVIDWETDKRKIERLGFLLEEGEAGRTTQLPMVSYFRYADGVEPGDRIDVDVFIDGTDTPITRNLKVADMKITGRGSEARCAYLLHPTRVDQ